MSGEMDVHPVRQELDFEDLKATEGYNPPDDFLIRVLPLDAGGALAGGEKTRDILWYEYPSPFEKTWDLQLQEETERKLQLKVERLRRRLEERERQAQQLEVDLHRRRVAERERQRQHQEESQRDWQYDSLRQLQPQSLNQMRLEARELGGAQEAMMHLERLESELVVSEAQEEMMQLEREYENQRRLVERELGVREAEEAMRQLEPELELERQYQNQRRLVERELGVREAQEAIGQLELEHQYWNQRRLVEMEFGARSLLDAIMHLEHEYRNHRRLLEREQQYLEVVRQQYLEVERQQYLEVQRQDQVEPNSSISECWSLDDETPTYSSSPPARDAHEEQQFHVDEHLVHVKMCEYDAANIPRYRLFKSEANTKKLLLGFDLKFPYYFYAGRCNLSIDGYEMRYADLFPNFRRWNYTWVRPTTYEGDCQFVNFFAKLMGEAEYINTRDRVLAKAIAIANKGFQKILYFQIELAVGDCMMLLEDQEKFEQRCDLYGYIASEICLKKKEYESVLEHIMNGHEGLRYELTELGSYANEDDAVEMREFVDHLVTSIPIELSSTTRADHVYKKWVSKQINLQFKPYFHLYENFLVEKINMAQDLDLVPEDMK